MDISSLFKSQTLLECFCRLVEASDGVVINSDDKTPGLAGDPDWVDMGDLYLAACAHLGRDPVTRGEDGDPWTGDINAAPPNIPEKYYAAYWVEVRNGNDGIDVLESASPIMFERAVAYFEDKFNLNWDRDGISLVDEITVLDMDQEAATDSDEEE